MSKTVLIIWTCLALLLGVYAYTGAWMDPQEAVPVQDRAADPDSQTGIGFYYSKSDKPTFLGGDGTVYDLSTGGGGGGGAGATTFAGNDGTDAVAAPIGTAPGGIFLIGTQGLFVVGSAGNTLWVTADALHAMVTQYVTQKFATMLATGAFTGATDFALDSAVSAFARALITAYTAASAFSGETKFAYDSQVSAFVTALLTAYTSTATIKASGFATDSAVSQFVTALITAYTNAVAGASLPAVYATADMLSAHTSSLTGTSGEMLANGSNAGDSIWTTAHLAPGVLIPSVGAAFIDAGAGASAFDFTKEGFFISGITMYCNVPGVGVSVFWTTGNTTAPNVPNPANGNEMLAQLSNGAGLIATSSLTGATYIPVGSTLCYRLPPVMINGASTWTIRLWGRKP